MLSSQQIIEVPERDVALAVIQCADCLAVLTAVQIAEKRLPVSVLLRACLRYLWLYRETCLPAPMSVDRTRYLFDARR